MNAEGVQRRPCARAPEPFADYVSVSWGQCHRLVSDAAAAGGPPLYALHGTAYSGRSFASLMRALEARTVVALDTPGYGGSTRPPERWPLARYAAALAEAMEAAGETRIDLLGYHTGALIAVLIAGLRPDLVRRLVLIGIPFFDEAAERQAWRARLAEPMHLTGQLGQFEERWDFLVSNRAQGASLDKGFAHFVDELRAYPYGFWAHEAAFTFDPAPSLSKVLQPTLVLNPATPLAEPSRRAAAHLAHAEVLELPHLGHGVLEVAATELAAHIEAFIDRPEPFAPGAP